LSGGSPIFGGIHLVTRISERLLEETLDLEFVLHKQELHGVMVSHFDSRFESSRRLQDDDSVIYVHSAMD